MNKIGLLALSVGITALLAAPAHAQQVKTNAKEKVKWYSAPREIQIIDDRPIVKDFREAPAAAQSIQLPPGPGSGNGFGGGGAGALGGDDGGTLPAGGMPMGNGGPGYRTDPGLANPLPHADFGHSVSNIPARGMGPKGPLPGGFNTGIHGRVNPFNPAQPNSAQAMRGPSGHPMARSAPAASYGGPGGGYGPSVGTGYGGGGASSSVSGKLLKKKF